LTDEEIYRELGFRFVSPGARALGTGGAFVAVADDLTAAQANPAGLATFSLPKFYAEYGVTNRDLRSTRGSSGSLAVDPVTGERDLPFFGVQSVSDVDTFSEPTVVGLAWPLPVGTGRTLTLSATRQVLLSEERALSSGGSMTAIQFAFDTFPNTVNGNQVEAYSVNTPVTGGVSSEVVYWNFAAALDVHPDFSVGATVTAATLDFRADTLTQVVDPLELFLDPTHPRLPDQTTSDVYRTTVNDSDTDVAFTVGVLWHPTTVFASGESPWQFGAVFRKGASFNVDESITLNGLPDAAFSNTIVVPDRYAVGMSYRANPRWLVTAEVERIEYSDLLEDFRTGVNFLTSERAADGTFAVDPDGSIEFDLDDGSVPRVGVEYSAAPGLHGQLALRAGYLRMPDDRIRMSRFNSSDPAVNAAYLGGFRGGEEQHYVTVGAGYSFGRSALELGGAISDDSTMFVGSYTFTLERQGGGTARPGVGSEP
jgi:long-subunit fatty acid transport protein